MKVFPALKEYSYYLKTNKESVEDMLTKAYTIGYRLGKQADKYVSHLSSEQVWKNYDRKNDCGQ